MTITKDDTMTVSDIATILRSAGTPQSEIDALAEALELACDVANDQASALTADGDTAASKEWTDKAAVWRAMMPRR